MTLTCQCTCIAHAQAAMLMSLDHEELGRWPLMAFGTGKAGLRLDRLPEEEGMDREVSRTGCPVGCEGEGGCPTEL